MKITFKKRTGVGGRETLFCRVRKQEIMVRQIGEGWIAFRTTRNGMSSRYDSPESAVMGLLGELTRPHVKLARRQERSTMTRYEKELGRAMRRGEATLAVGPK